MFLRPWEDFSMPVQNLRWSLVAWLEALLGRPVTRYPGSGSVQFPPNKRSKYKLLPFDEQGPFEARGEGIALCIDAAEYQREFDEDPGAGRNLIWLPQPVTVQVGSGSRTYRVALIPADEQWQQRIERLRDLAMIVRQIEA